MIFVLRKREVLKKRRREQLSQNTDSHSPVVCVCGLVLWVPWVISQPAAHEGWWLLALRPLRHFRSLWRRIAHCASLLSGTDGAVARAGEGSLFCHFPCRTLSVGKKRLQTPELSIWHFSLALKNNFKIYFKNENPNLLYVNRQQQEPYQGLWLQARLAGKSRCCADIAFYSW